MSKSYLSVDFSTNSYSDAKLTVKVSTIIEDLTGNVTFKALEADVVVLKTKNDLLISYLPKVGDGSKLTTAEKNTARKDLEDYLHIIGNRVQDISGGDELKILSSGFDLRAKPAPIGMLPMPTGVTVAQGQQSGTLVVNWNVVGNTYLYMVRYTNAPSSATSIWKQVSTGKHKTILSSFKPGEAIAIQVAAAGTDPNLVWSTEVIVYCMF